MTKTIEISIIIPIYNVEDYIENTMISICNQNYKNFEVILVDDGSLDKSSEIATYILKKNNIDFTLVRQKNAGQGIARNTGFNLAKGQWVMFIDSDDTIQNFALQ